MKILLLSTALNGLSQRAWCAVERAGHDASVRVVRHGTDIREAVRLERPDLILCPFLTAKVPDDFWQETRTIVIHPGPVGDRGPSSLDWAVLEGERRWGVTALQAVEEMDAGPIWATRTFDLPDPAPRKSAVYNGPVADGAIACIEEVLVKAADPGFVPTPLAEAHRPIPSARLRPRLPQEELDIDWASPTRQIVRQVRAGDGAPGALAELGGRQVRVYDITPARLGEVEGHVPARPGEILCFHGTRIHVRTGDGSVWLGQVRAADDPTAESGVKLPATHVLTDLPSCGPCLWPHPSVAEREISYHREGEVGWLTFDFYNGAMSTRQCWTLLAALRRALAEDTRVLVLRSGPEAFSNGIHLGVIEAAESPAIEAWANIRAINAVCREIIGAGAMTVVSAFTGSAGAGGVMMGLGADVVVARAGVVLNPYYDIGLFGSELHTLVLPRRVGPEAAHRLLTGRRPIDAQQAGSMGLVDAVGPRELAEFQEWLRGVALFPAGEQPGARRAAAGSPGLPVDVVEVRELAEMSHDMFGDRSGFAAARRAFVRKEPRPVAHAGV